MCKLSSGILSKDGVYWLEDSDSHTEIISRIGHNGRRSFYVEN